MFAGFREALCTHAQRYSLRFNVELVRRGEGDAAPEKVLELPLLETQLNDMTTMVFCSAYGLAFIGITYMKLSRGSVVVETELIFKAETAPSAKSVEEFLRKATSPDFSLDKNSVKVTGVFPPAPAPPEQGGTTSDPEQGGTTSDPEQGGTTSDPDIDFVNICRGVLIQRVEKVDDILKLLVEEGGMHAEAFERVKHEINKINKMRRLFMLLDAWGEKAKHIFYKGLQVYERMLLNDLMEQFNLTSTGAPPYAPDVPEASGNSAATAQGPNSDPESQFVDANRDELINRVKMVSPILDQLFKEGVINQEGYDEVRAKDTSMNKMRRLYDLLTTGKAKKVFYRGLEKNEKCLLDDLMPQ